MELTFPSTAAVQDSFRAAYQMIAVYGDDVLLRLRNAAGGYDDVGPLKAMVSALRLTDLVAGSTAQIGDLRAILLSSSIPPGQRRMEQKDRILWRGREYAVLQYDDATPSVGGEVLAVNIIIRG
jgi:hypothetical protein